MKFAKRVDSKHPLFAGHRKHPLPTAQEITPHMDIIRWSKSKIRFIIFYTARDGEALYNQQKKQDWELTGAQIMNSLLPNSDLN